jgi:biopolymer transport protein ExbB/TolQ
MIESTLHPILGSGALQFAFEKATTEGKITIGSLIIVSLFSWTVILTKAWQLTRARRVAKKFFEAYRVTRDPLELARKQTDFDGAPAFELYSAGVQELSYQLENNPVDVRGQKRISSTSFTSVKAALERTAAEQALSLEKGMIVLSTAVAGGPFIGLLGTVWGVMETFSGIANLHAQLVELRTADPDLSVIVRGDSKTRYERIVDILDLLQQANVLKVNLATEPLKEGEL